MSELDISIDRAHYNKITETATNVDNLIRAVDRLVTAVDELKTGLSECLTMQKDVVVIQRDNLALREDVEKLQIDASNLKGKLAAIVVVFGIAASWIGNIIPNLVGGVR